MFTTNQKRLLVMALDTAIVEKRTSLAGPISMGHGSIEYRRNEQIKDLEDLRAARNEVINILPIDKPPC